jgi:hypothetical protein
MTSGRERSIDIVLDGDRHGHDDILVDARRGHLDHVLRARRAATPLLGSRIPDFGILTRQVGHLIGDDEA